MKILLFGKNGQVARRLYPALLPLGTVIVYGSKDLDLRDLEKLRECIRRHKPNVIVNAAGYTAVDKAESDKENAFALNAEALRVMAEEATEIDAWLVHYSTDYVFDGSKNVVYTEEDKPNPLGVYAQSKLAGDNYITSICNKYIILRTSWVFDSYGKNFAKTILALAQKNDSLRVVNDQIGAPTSASLIATVTAFILYRIMYLHPELGEGFSSLGSGGKERSGSLCSRFALSQDDGCVAQNNIFSGIYNLSSSGEISWYGFAYALVKRVHEMGVPLICLPENIIPIASTDYPTPAARPLNSRLNTMKLTNQFGLVMPTWELYIDPLLDDLKIMGII